MSPSEKQKGFALIDAMIAVFVVATGLVAAIDMISAMQIEMDMNRKYMLMGLLAQSKLEEYDAATAQPGASANGDFGGADYGSIPHYKGFTWSMTSADISGGCAGGTTPCASVSLAGTSKKVSVTVTAKDLRGKSHTMTLHSIHTKRG